MPHEDALGKVPLFETLSRKDLARLGRAVVERKYKKGETIVKEGEQAVAFFMISKGRVAVSRAGKSKNGKALAEFGAGNVFGEMALLDGLPRDATVKAIDDTECLVLSRWDFVAELRTNPHIAVAMLPILSRRLRQANAKLESM
ncbi:MAG: cyclic nucleotide-binding domain-containing protein [Dehalococcoidia bacterium]